MGGFNSTVVDGCIQCGGWGLVRASGICLPCGHWRPRRGLFGRCRRCRHGVETRLNLDGVCRLCVLESRLHPDEEWAAAFLAGGPLPERHLQLSFVVPPGTIRARTPPLGHRGTSAQRGPERGASPSGGTGEAVRDDLRICTPQIPGQLPLPLPRMRRMFLFPHANRIADRQLPGADQVAGIVREMQAELGKGTFWRTTVARHVRLALATREADEDLVDVRVLPDLPGLDSAVAQVLDRAGLLSRPLGVTAPRYQPYVGGRVVPHRVLRKTSCGDCLAWGGDHRPVCDRCWHWRRQFPVGECGRCGRELPVKEGRCYFCHLVLHEHVGDGEPVDQLWFGGAFAPTLFTRGGRGRPEDRKDGRRVARQRADRAAKTAAEVSPSLVDPAQLGLFPSQTRDWSRVHNRPLPALTAEAEGLVDDLRRHGRERNWWPSEHEHHAVGLLRLVVSHLGCRAPLREADIRAAAALDRNWHARRILYFLAARRLLVAEPADGRDRDERAVQRFTADVPAAFQDDVRCWTTVLRGGGRWPSLPLPWSTIRNYLCTVLPTLASWAETLDALREVTPEQVRAAVDGVAGSRARTVQAALRSLFRALKRERRIFRDPARSLTLPAPARVPRPLPQDQITGLLDRAGTPTAAAVLALTAIHAIGVEQLRHARLDHLNRAGGRLLLTRPGTRRTVVLDEITLALLDRMLRERHRRWPRCPNPHLIVSQITAQDPAGPAVSTTVFQEIFTTADVPAQRLRRDRILDEARHTADPVHLTRMFGISVPTAIAYTRAAHPERFTIDPAQA